MAVVLQILGVLFLALVLTIVVLFLVIRAKARRFLKTLGDLAEQAQKAAVTPARIELVPMAVNDWDNPDAVRAQADPLAALGFEKAGDFEVRPVDGLRIEAWVKPSEAVTAVIYEHPHAGVWADLYTHFEDGTRVTYLNSAVGGGVDHAPGHDVQRFAGMELAELYRKFLAERPQKPAKRYGPADFAAAFEQAYADEMDWRNARGGPTEQEIRAVAALAGNQYSDDEIEMTRALMAEQAREQLEESLLDNFLSRSGMSATEWERIRERVVVIHDKLPSETVGEILSERCEDEEMDRFDYDSDQPITARFAAFNDALPARRRFRLLGTVDEPVAAAVYCAAE